MRFLVLILFVLSLVAVSAQNLAIKTSRGGKAQRTRTVSATVTYDTVMAPAADSVVVSGFSKPLRATRETMFVTNHTAMPMCGLAVEIEYLDMRGRQLHKAVHELSEAIPPGETRMVRVPTFDSASEFYYHLSAVPARATHATPFEVKITVKYTIHPTQTQE